MKHIFGISSHLAFYLCQRVIEQDSLDVKDCIFFTIDSYSLPTEHIDYYAHVDITKVLSRTTGRIFVGWRFWKTAENIARIDKMIEQYVDGDEYIWYTQICFNDLCSVMVTNPKCAGYYVLEDGSGSYIPEDPPTFQGWRAIVYHCLLKPLYPRIYILKNHLVEINHPKFKGCIASNDACFPLYKRYVRIVGMPFRPEPLQIGPDAVISIDPLFRWGVTDNQAQQLIKQLANYVNARHYSHIVYKHHPAILSPLQKERYFMYNTWVCQYFEGEIEELNAQVSLENTLMAHPSADFYTAVSTVAIYAHAMGVSCYTYCPLLRQFVDKAVPVVENICIPINPT